MPVVTHTYTNAGGPVEGVGVRIRPVLPPGIDVSAYHAGSGDTVEGTTGLTTGVNGQWSITLHPTSQLTPAGVYYEVRQIDPTDGRETVVLVTVPVGGGPYELETLPTLGPGQPAPPPGTPASDVTFTPYSSIAATNVQAAIQELLDEGGVGGGGGGSAITVQDEGVALATAAQIINFAGAGVTVSGGGTTKTVTIPGDAAAVAAEAVTARAAESANSTAITNEATARSTADTNHAGAADPHPAYALDTDLVAEAARATAAENARLAIAGHTAESIPAAVGGTSLADLVVPASRLLGRKATGSLGALTVGEVLTLLAVYTSAQTDSAIAAAIANLVASAPGALDTLNELATALGDDPNFATTITNLIATEATTARAAEALAALKANNLSDLASAPTARNNLGLLSGAVNAKVAAGGAGVLDATDPSTTNARTPTAHAHPESDVTGLAADLTARVLALTPTAVKTANYTAAANEYVPVDTTSGNATVTLPTAPADKTRVAIKQVVRGGANTVTYACGGSDVLNRSGGATSGTLTLLAHAVLLQYQTSGAIWTVQAGDIPLSQLDARFATAAQGTDARTPTAHASTHNAGGSDALAIDAAAATGSLRTLGTGATQAMAGNDSRVPAIPVTGTPAIGQVPRANSTSTATWQAPVDPVDLAIIKAGSQRIGVISGCAVTAQGTPNMTVAVATGQISSGNANANASVTPGNVTITTADATNPRYDLIVVDNTGAKSATAGTPAASPVLPAAPVTGSGLVLAVVYVPAAVTAITTAMITDKRVTVPVMPFPSGTGGVGTFLGAVPSGTGATDWFKPLYALSKNSSTTISNDATDQTIATLTVTAARCVAGDIIFYSASGSMLNSSGGTVTYTFRFKINGVTYLATTAISQATNATAKNWSLDLKIVIESTTAQRIGGLLVVATTTAASGMAAVAAASSFIADAAATEDTSAANTPFAVTCQMGTASASASVTCRQASLAIIRP